MHLTKLLLPDTLVCFRSQEKEGATEVKVIEPSNAATEVEEKEIHVDTEEKRDEQIDCIDSDDDETPPQHQVPQPSNEATVLQQDTSAEAYELSYSIYPASCSSWPNDPLPAYYNPSMSENPPYYPYDVRCYPNHQSESSTDDLAHRLADWLFGFRFYYH